MPRKKQPTKFDHFLTLYGMPLDFENADTSMEKNGSQRSIYIIPSGPYFAGGLSNTAVAPLGGTARRNTCGTGPQFMSSSVSLILKIS